MLRVLVVCSGNTCRSPMAGGILESLMRGRCRDVEVKTAGLYPGRQVAEAAKAVMLELGIDISVDYPKKASLELLKWADLIIPVKRVYGEHLLEDHPEISNKLLYLNREICDPFGSDIEKYREVRDALREALEEAVKRWEAQRSAETGAKP